MKNILYISCLSGCCLLAAHGEAPISGFPEKLAQPPTAAELEEPARIDYSTELIRPLTEQEQNAQIQATGLDGKAVEALREDSGRSSASEAREDARVDKVVREFCSSQGIELPLAVHARPAVSEDQNTTATKEDMVITCDKGVYFDSQQGLLVYIGNVKLRDPRLDLDCDNQLKVYLQEGTKKKEEKKPDNDEKEAKKESRAPKTPADTMNVNFDGLKKVTAEGNVVMNRKDEKGKPYQARAQHVTYNAVTGEILLTGGRPSLQDEKNIVRCLTDDGYIRVSEDGKVYIHGKTTTKMRDVQNQSSGFGKSDSKSGVKPAPKNNRK